MLFLSVLIWLDFRLLHAALTVVVWTVEWLSVPQRWLERGMIGLYLLSSFAMFWSEQVVTGERTISGWGFFVLAFLLLCLVRDHRRSSSERARRLFTIQVALSRVYLTVLVTPLICLLGSFTHHLRVEVAMVANHLMLLACVYVLALPDCGTRGRRRREALAKLSLGQGVPQAA